MFCTIWDNGDNPLVIGIEYYIRGCASKQCNSYGEGKLVNGDDDLLCSEKIFEIGYSQSIKDSLAKDRKVMFDDQSPVWFRICIGSNHGIVNEEWRLMLG